MKTEKVLQHLIGKTYEEVIKSISFEEDHGDCCGYADVTVTDALAEIDNAESAVLVDVVSIDYDDDYEEDRQVINFVFSIGANDGVILGYELSAGSGTGWSYGARCVLKFDGEEIASACW